MIDWKNPNYFPTAKARAEALARVRATDGGFAALKDYYRDGHYADFIDDWGVTYDPRNIELGRAPIVPFSLFPKQREYVEWVVDHWRRQRPGLTEKSRDGGISWLCVAIGCALCILHEGMAIGFGSRKEEYVDQIDEPKSLFWKIRFFMRYLPKELRAGWREGIDSPHMRVKFPETGSFIGGEAGDEIGRGDRRAIYFVDEAAHLQRPKLVDAALSQTTNCRIDVSSVNGPNNPFAVKRHSGKIDVFVWDWRDDPRKDEAWYRKQQEALDPVVLAQEVDRDYSATIEGVVIHGKWLRSCIDARQKLGLGEPTGERVVAFDVADEGADKNATVSGKGYEIDHAQEWSGLGDDIFGSVERVFALCDELGVRAFRYDADGIGAGVRGDARIINGRRKDQKRRPVEAEAYRGSSEVLNPEAEDVAGRKNKDFFQNRKAQAWWAMRARAQRTHRWVTEGVACDPDEILSISSKCPNYLQLVAELGQPQFKTNDVGKVVILKKPDGMRSPNMADAAVMKFARGQRRVRISESFRRFAAQPGPRSLRYGAT